MVVEGKKYLSQLVGLLNITYKIMKEIIVRVEYTDQKTTTWSHRSRGQPVAPRGKI
jgi:hypothetical protein